MLSMKFGSMPSTQPYLDPCLDMSRTFGADLRKEGCKKVAFLKDAIFEAKILPRLEMEIEMTAERDDKGTALGGVTHLPSPSPSPSPPFTIVSLTDTAHTLRVLYKLTPVILPCKLV